MLAPGTTLGPYTILDLVAVGGMGEVYRAEDSRLHRDVAIKVLPAHLAADRGSLERFRREARAVAALSHPNILAIFDVGSENGVHYAVTELLEGQTLRARLGGGPLAPREALEIMLAIADGVAAAHARGIVHRDLKPENIFITREGRVKVLDFGIARAGSMFVSRDEKAPTEMLPTEPGIVLGTVGYLAPEQLEARPLTPAADVFALGCMLYEMIAGRLPFERASAAHAMVALLHDDAPRLAADGDRLLRDVDALVQRCLEKSPLERPADAGVLSSELRALLGGERLSRRFRATARAEKALGPRAVAIVLLVVLIAATLLFVDRTRNRQIDQGYDLRASDIRGDGETTRLIELALHADAEGNRAKAMELFEEAQRRNAKTAFPAAFLSSFDDAAGNFAPGQQWAKLAEQRLDSGGASTYESLLARFLLVPAGDRARELALANSALEVRPEAWRLRLAAAHIELEQRDREAARRELQRIDVHKPDDRRLMLVLADRASLGDIAGAERDLHASRLMTRPAFRHYTEARIAWSRGNAKRAGQLFDLAADDAGAEDLGPLEAEARVLAGIALIRQHAWNDAQRRLALAGARARQLGLQHRVFDSSAFGAYVAWREGDTVERDRKLAAAMAVGPPAAEHASLRLLAIRMGSPLWRTWSTKDIEAEPMLAANVVLIHAREAWAAGDLDTAARELRRARAEGIDSTGDREEAELFAAELGLPAQKLPADPPYPNSLRFLAIFDFGLRQR